jgi:hypothetical protein
MARTASGPGSTHSAARIACVLLLAALAGACGERAGDQSTHSGDDVEPLPAPAQVQGSVTGMPGKPGPGEVPLSGDPPPPPPRPEGIAMDLERLEDNPETGLATPATGDAAQVVRDYYAALAARDHARAYAAWSDGGRASGLDPAGFAASFDDVIGIEATVGEPEPVADADGARQAAAGAWRAASCCVPGAPGAKPLPGRGGSCPRTCARPRRPDRARCAAGPAGTAQRLGWSIVPVHFFEPQRQAQSFLSFAVCGSSSTMP